MARMASGKLFQSRGAASTYVVCIVEPPAGGRPRSVAQGSLRNELVGRLCMMQLVREGIFHQCITLWSVFSSPIVPARY